MKHICLLFFILLLSFEGLYAQKAANTYLKHKEFCDENIPTNLIPRLKKELSDLEQFFINKGLLLDNTGKSYYKVYEMMAKEGDLYFTLDTSFALIDSLDFSVPQKCFYRVVSDEQLSELKKRHHKAAQKIVSKQKGDITLRIIAQRVITHLKEEDFDLEFYRVSSLLSFYMLSNHIEMVPYLPNNVQVKAKVDNTLKLVLNENSELYLNNQVINHDRVEEVISGFLNGDLTKLAIEIDASRSATYESLMKLMKVIDSRYEELRNEQSLIEYSQVYSKLITEHKKNIDRKMPKNVSVSEPK
jgi:hypothetical protein